MAAATGEDGARIGERLRAARLARRMTLAEVAAASGLTKGFLSKLERDQASASVASLMQLCAALKIAVGTLFNASPGEVVRHDAYPRINFGGTGMVEYLLTPHGERRLQAILSDIEPGGGSGEQPYSLPADVEFVFVLSGQLTVTLRGERTVLDAGDVLSFLPHVPHTFLGTAAEGNTKVLWVYSPALPDTDHPVETP